MKRILLVLLATLSSVACSQEIDFVWDMPTERVDGSSLLPNEIDGYTLYEDNEAIAYIEGTQLWYTHEYDGYGQPCYQISTTDTWQREGPQSAPVCVDVFPGLPMPPLLKLK